MGLNRKYLKPNSTRKSAWPQQPKDDFGVGCSMNDRYGNFNNHAYKGNGHIHNGEGHIES